YRQELINETLNKFNGIDILVNNVGIGSGKELLEIDYKDLKKSIETNLIAPFFLSQKAARIMIDKKINGTIIFISSIHERIPSGNIDYSSTKSAITMTVKELAYDLGKYGIRVNGIAPGRITKEKIDDQRIPLSSQSGTTEDIADIVTFLSNITLSGYITGETITVDGGLSLHFER
ncbi:SDR family oxidoreductase, partial [Patescibacteria group bacterium]|nr:SDR family oxidoreductase [Patescibacteria group bacterium]